MKSQGKSEKYKKNFITSSVHNCFFFRLNKSILEAMDVSIDEVSMNEMFNENVSARLMHQLFR